MTPLLIYIFIAFVVYKLVRLWLKVSRKKKSLGAKGLAGIIAHRGSRMEGLPENTVAAFADAVHAGTDIIELDVWITPDQKVVVHHDETLSRMSGDVVHDKIWQTRFKDLPRIEPSGEQKKRCKDYPESDVYQIPLFEDVLRSIPKKVSLIVEFKNQSDFLVAEVLRILTEQGRKEDVYWFSLDENINCKLRSADPSIPTITSIMGMLKVLLLYYLGVLPLVELDDAVFGITVEEITLDKIRKEKPLKGFPDWFKRVLAYLFRGKPPYAMLAPRLFAQLRERGVPVWFLGVNTEEDLTTAINSGATGVLTDRVNWLTSLMKYKNLEFKKIST